MVTVKKTFADSKGQSHPDLDEAFASELMIAGVIDNYAFAKAVIKNRDMVMKILEDHKSMEFE